LEKLGTARRLEPIAKARSKLFEETCVELVDEDLWMYVAPWDIPLWVRRRRVNWNPVLSPGSDCIVIGAPHFRTSPELVLFLDIFHELCHIQQRHRGADLFGGDLGYVDRPTEIDAYRFVVQEGRRLGVGDEVLRDYLKVEWIDRAEFGRLLRAVEVSEAVTAAARV
jgi:hypothetical protein